MIRTLKFKSFSKAETSNQSTIDSFFYKLEKTLKDKYMLRHIFIAVKISDFYSFPEEGLKKAKTK